MDKAEQTAEVARMRLGITHGYCKEDVSERTSRRQTAKQYLLKFTKRDKGKL